MQLGELDAHLHAQRGVEVGQRLVEQEDLGLAHDGAADGDALALAAGKLLGLALQQLVELQDARRLGDCASISPCGTPASRSAKAMFSRDRHMRIERIGLEHHGDAALGRAARR